MKTDPLFVFSGQNFISNSPREPAWFRPWANVLVKHTSSAPSSTGAAASMVSVRTVIFGLTSLGHLSVMTALQSNSHSPRFDPHASGGTVRCFGRDFKASSRKTLMFLGMNWCDSHPNPNPKRGVTPSVPQSDEQGNVGVRPQGSVNHKRNAERGVICQLGWLQKKKSNKAGVWNKPWAVYTMFASCRPCKNPLKAQDCTWKEMYMQNSTWKTIYAKLIVRLSLL